MGHMLIKWLMLAIAIYLIAMVIPGVRIKGFKAALVVAAIYGLLNFLLFRVLFIITFPLIILKYLTLGIFGVIMNAILLVITDRLVDDFQLAGFGSALFAAFGISIVNLILSLVVF